MSNIPTQRPVIKYKEGDVVRLSRAILGQVYYGNPKNKDEYEKSDEPTMSLGTERQVTIFQVSAQSFDRRTSGSIHQAEMSEDYTYRLLYKFGATERYRTTWEVPKDDADFAVSVPHNNLRSGPETLNSKNPLAAFCERNDIRMLTQDTQDIKKVVNKIQVKKTFKKGDWVIILSRPETKGGKALQSLMIDHAYYSVVRIKSKQKADYFWKSDTMVEYTAILGLAKV